MGNLNQGGQADSPWPNFFIYEAVEVTHLDKGSFKVNIHLLKHYVGSAPNSMGQEGL